MEPLGCRGRIGYLAQRRTFVVQSPAAIKKCIWVSDMPVLTITSRKGGCGKTMLSTVVAGSLADRGIDVALLDADPNGAAHRWATETHTGQKIKSYAEADAERLADLLPTLAQR